MPMIKLRSSSLQPNIHLGGTPTASQATLTQPPAAQTDTTIPDSSSNEPPASSSNDVN
jgi:hypothetical protein